MLKLYTLKLVLDRYSMTGSGSRFRMTVIQNTVKRNFQKRKGFKIWKRRMLHIVHDK